MDLDALLRESLAGLLRELTDGPPGDLAFIVNPGDPGLLASLAKVPASTASAKPNGRSSVAAHVHHVKYGLELLNRWVRGDERAFADANYDESWGHQTVNEGQWRELREGLERELRSWSAVLSEPREWSAMTLSALISSVAHLAYHIGAIRQLLPSGVRS